tara:strand:- start:7444 stop:7635 length:192 start_codon:yes stop_codon:yes gene_type:complete
VVLNSGEFETSGGDTFTIAITQESDHSIDGGHTFETITNKFEIDRINANYLVNELQHFIKYGN